MVSQLVKEKDFAQTVVEYAKLCGWTVFFTQNSRTRCPSCGEIVSHGGGRPAGEPDLRLIKGPRMVWAELKSATGQPTPTQVEVLEYLQVNGHEAYLWRPENWSEIEVTLGGG